MTTAPDRPVINDPLSTTVEVAVNGSTRQITVATSALLHDVLRTEFDCRSVRASCERGVCGACTVLIDGTPFAACSTFAFAVDGTSIETVEGLPQPEGELSAAQQGFAEKGGFQCGYCTSGMLMLTTALLRESPEPDRDEIREWISSNTCRCTGYEMIFESVERAAEIGACQRYCAGGCSRNGQETT